MKKLVYFFLLTIFFINNSFAQSESEILDNIAKTFAKEAYITIWESNPEVQQATKYRDTVYVIVNFLYNDKGQQTKLSSELGYRIANYLNIELDLRIKKITYVINSPYDFDIPSEEKLSKYKTNDFTFTGQYIIGENEIKLTKFQMKQINGNYIIPIKDQKIKEPQVNLITKYDKIILNPDIYSQFFDFKKDNTFVKSINITHNKVSVPQIKIDGIGQVYTLKYDNDYNIGVELAKNSYLYFFFYDENDQEYPFIWAIENKNVEIKKGTYTDFLDYNLNFFQTNQSEKGAYKKIKIIATKDKINIDKFYTRKFIDKEEAVFVDEKGCSQLLDQIKLLTDIQTINLILTF